VKGNAKCGLYEYIIIGKHGMQVAAVVFFGRRRNVKILNTYLERNLVSAGGVLHEVETPGLQFTFW
jgi:hypothetical protein